MEVRDLLRLEIQVGLVITLLVTVFYGFVAPWYKQSAGRYIFGLLVSLTLVLSNSVLGIYFPGIAYRREIGALLFGIFIFAIAAIGFGIYRAQWNGYRRRKFVEQEKERHRQL